ncbi:MAG: archease [Candidatus Omnitrophica bacterium]|nr:archease [Candidatus Omnitrophota bacterium]
MPREGFLRALSFHVVTGADLSVIIENMERYRQIPHTADIAARIYGSTLKELFRNAAFAMFDMSADLSSGVPDIVLQVRVGGADMEDLLVSWLNELLYRSSSEDIIFTGFAVDSLHENELKAAVKGFKAGPGKRVSKNEIKAATYHDLNIEKTPTGYEVTVVFDV